MKKLTKLQIELKEINDEIARQNELKQLKKKELVELCPVKIGDEVEVTGYSHQGKTIVVSSITYHPYTSYGFGSDKTDSLFLCRGRVKKIDGSLGVNCGEHRC